MSNRDNTTRTCNKKGPDINRRPFSLIEIMLACLLLAICGAVCSIQFKQSYDERRAKNVLQLIERKLQLASTLARITQEKVVVVIKNGPPVLISLSNNIKISEKIKKLLDKEEKLDAVTKVQLIPEPHSSETDRTEIYFYPWGVEDPTNLLEVSINAAMFTIPLEKYALPFASPQEDITKIFPDAVIKNEKENVRAH